jgi:hypothetical protein
MHPRLKHYPHHADYLVQANEFRPFVTTIGEPNYRSNSLNTDDLGMRVQHFADGEAIDFNQLKGRVSECNLMLGGSTVFGVTATGDTKTAPACLAMEGLPCINWGVRGATCQQELVLFLMLRYLLPEQRNIVLLTGVNDVSLATLLGAIPYPSFGGIFGEGFYFRQFTEELQSTDLRPLELDRLHEWVDEIWARNEMVRRFARLLMRRSGKQVSLRQKLTVEEQFLVVCRHVQNVMQSWGGIQSATGSRLHYVLQPAIGWTSKPLAPIEAECFDEDLGTIESVKLFTDHALYLRFRQHVKACCEAAAIRFYDANEWLGEARFATEDIFTDSCHFNDRGYRMLGKLLRERVDWK